MRRIFVAHFIGPGQIHDSDAIRPIARQRRRLAANPFGLLLNPQPAIDAVNAAGAVHVGQELAEAFRLGLGGVHDRLGFGDGRAVFADDGGDLVEGVALCLL
jgi:hypothetical protein